MIRIFFVLALLLIAVMAPYRPAMAQVPDPARLVVGLALEPPHLDPTAGAAAAIDEVTYANVFEGLTRIDESGNVQPALAESWTVSEDALTYVFTLREGVRFHDGTVFDSADAKFSLDRARTDDSTNAQKALYTVVANVETPDPRTVVVTLSKPDGLFLFNLGRGDAVMVAPESAGANKTRPVGTGPFRFESWQPGHSVVLVRNPDYRDPSKPAVDRVEFRFIADPAAQLAAILAGDVHAFANFGATEMLPAIENDSRFAVEIGTTEGETILVPNQRRAPFDDVRVRRALSHLVDRPALIEGAMFGKGTPIGSHFAPHNPAYVDLTGTYPRDVAAAKALLAEAGYPDGFEATLTLPPPAYARRGGEILAAQLAEAGIRVRLEPVEWAQWLERVFTGHDFDLTIVSHVEPLDIGIYARDDYYFGYDNPEFDAVIEELRRTVDPARRAELYGRAQRILAQDAANVFLFQLPKVGVRRAELKGLWVDAPIEAMDVTAARWE